MSEDVVEHCEGNCAGGSLIPHDFSYPTVGGTAITPWLVSPSIGNPFDPKKDYCNELAANEMFEKDGIQVVKLIGLQRLAHNNRGGVRQVESQIKQVPGLAPEHCIAAVTVIYHFNDGTSFAGSADASYKAHDAPFNLHLVAVAESKAEARALRRAFNISKVSYEEIGLAGNTDNDPIEQTTVRAIKNVAKRKGVELDKVVEMTGLSIKGLEELTQGQGRELMSKLNRRKG